MPPSAASAAGSSSALRAVALPRPSYAPRRLFSTNGKPKRAAAPATSSCRRSGAKAGSGTPAAAKCSFCANLSWISATAAAEGTTRTRPSASIAASVACRRGGMRK